MFRKLLFNLYFDIILIADNHPTVYEKLVYFLKLVAAFAPIAYVLAELGLWFADNQRFVSFMISAIIINAGVGIGYHRKMKSFSWEMFIKGNSMIVAVVIIIYILLEQLRLTAGDNIAGEVFKVAIQIATLLYPTSKAVKNIYILSNKQHPPEWIMNKLYNFEKTGNIKDLFDTEGAPSQNQDPQ